MGSLKFWSEARALLLENLCVMGSHEAPSKSQKEPLCAESLPKPEVR